MTVFVLSMLSLVSSAQLLITPEECHTDLQLFDSSGEVLLTIPGGYTGTVPGLPDIPSYPEFMALEKGTAAVSVSVTSAEWETAGTGVKLRPLPVPCILSAPSISASTVPSPVFSMNMFWPEEPVELTATGFSGSGPVAELTVTPFRYNPVTGELQRLVSASLWIETEPAPPRSLPAADSDLERMLIITDSEIRVPFDSLAAWRTAEGLLTEVVTTDEVYAVTGSDDAEKIRNYIIEYRNTHGLHYVLLGGDTNYIPCRQAYPMSYGPLYGSYRSDNMPCDLYFSDLDGDWNADGDTIWGEVEDNVDLHADVHVGRAPCEDLDEAWTFWNKIKTYETSPDMSHHDDGILAGGILWSEPLTDEKVVKTYIKENWFPSWFFFEELFTSTGNYNTSNMIAALNQGAGYVNMNDHGWTQSVGCLDNGDVDQVNSGDRFFGMMYSIGCWTSAFDYNSVSEHFLNNPDGCGVSYIGNSSYGWGSPGNPLFGYSDRFDISLFEILFQQPELSLGELLSTANEGFIPFAHQENCYRCVLYMVNLLGDPSLHTFRRIPVTPEVEYPEFVTATTSALPVTVTVPGGYQPEEITVCVSDGSENYLVEQLDGSGFIILNLTSPPAGDMTLTVTGTDLIRTALVIPQATGPLPVLTGVSISTPEGYGSAAPGTQASVTITLSNQGTESLSGTSLTASLVQGPGTLTQASSTFGSLAPGASSQGSEPLLLNVNPDATTGQLLKLEIDVTATEGSWTFDLPLLVFAPGLCFSTYSVDDTAGGNGNGYAEPGESFQLMLQVANTGLLTAQNVTAQLSSEESWLTWDLATSSLPEIEPFDTGEFTFSGTVAPSAPEMTCPPVMLTTYADPQWESDEEFLFTVGNFHTSEDFENGPGSWTHSGSGDMWQLTQLEAHSGQWAWYCGDETTGTYETGMNCALLSPAVYLPPNGEMTFWSCFNVDLYGADGLYVLLQNMTTLQVDTLDFIGAGGLLGLQSMFSDGNMMWLPRTYDLSGYEAGSQIQVAFVFFSDDTGDNLGGFHIDDVTITGSTDPMGSGGQALDCLLGSPVPNPSPGCFSVTVNVPEGSWELKVFDLSGRVVHETVREQPYVGTFGMDISGIPSGIYFLQLRTGQETQTRKAIISI